MQMSRTPDIVAEAAYYILKRPSTECSGNFFIDEDVLREEGITDFENYAVNPKQKLMTDIFLDE
jgi:citronellol/citronellal dehydrogenase